MIITKAPLRISFFGGRTDIPSFYENHGGGCSFGTTINKYVYVAYRARQDHCVNIHSYYGYFVYDSWREIGDPLIYRCFSMANDYGFDVGADLWISSDVTPGSGLGTSSAMLVALLASIFKSNSPDAEELAEWAADIEMAAYPVGKQDAYFSAYGGVCKFHYFADGSVGVERVSGFHEEDRLLLFNTGIVRESSRVLSAPADPQTLRFIRLLAKSYNPFYYDFDKFLRDTWNLKRSITSVADDGLNAVYDKAMKVGGKAGKLLGAGGGGHFLFCVDPEDQMRFIREMARIGLIHIPFRLEPRGVQYIEED